MCVQVAELRSTCEAAIAAQEAAEAEAADLSRQLEGMLAYSAGAGDRLADAQACL